MTVIPVVLAREVTGDNGNRDGGHVLGMSRIELGPTVLLTGLLSCGHQAETPLRSGVEMECLQSILTQTCWLKMDV